MGRGRLLIRARLTAKLVVIVVSLINHRPGLAVGNIIGSVIANILGAFSLGLIIYNPSDDSAQSSSIESGSRVYALLLLVITAVCSMLCVIRERLSRTIVGVFLICAFAGYIISLSVLISRGLARKPEELSDSDSDSDTSSSHSVDHEEEASVQGARPGYGTIDRQVNRCSWYILASQAHIKGFRKFPCSNFSHTIGISLTQAERYNPKHRPSPCRIDWYHPQRIRSLERRR